MSKSPEEIFTLGQIAKAAHLALDENAWDYLIGGSETETTFMRNRQSLDEIAFRPRVLNDVAEITTGAKFFGEDFRLPVFLAPIGSAEQLNEKGILPAAKAAAEFGVPLIKSSVAIPDIEELAEQTNAHLIFQLYVRGDEDWIMERVDRVTKAGYKAFCLTVDSAVYGRRERDKIKNFVPVQRSFATGREFQAALNWDIVGRLREKTDLPLMLKGIMTEEDARIAVDHGIDVIYISNHGGRQLDHGQGAIEVLPEIVDAVAGRASVVIDGGFYRGTDVLKAIALGADAVGLGRLFSFGLGAFGQSGVARVLEILEEEIQQAMALLGVCKLDDITPDHLHEVAPVRFASPTSSYHLFDFDNKTY